MLFETLIHRNTVQCMLFETLIHRNTVPCMLFETLIHRNTVPCMLLVLGSTFYYRSSPSPVKSVFFSSADEGQWPHTHDKIGQEEGRPFAVEFSTFPVLSGVPPSVVTSENLPLILPISRTHRL
jgi:hypothetical protein